MEKRHKPQVIHLYRAQVQQLLLYSTIGGGGGGGGLTLKSTSIERSNMKSSVKMN